MKFLIPIMILLSSLFANVVYAYPYKYDNRSPYRVELPKHPMATRKIGIIMSKQTLEHRLKKYDDNGYIIQEYCRTRMEYCQEIGITKYINSSNDIKRVHRFDIGVEDEVIDYLSYAFNKPYKEPQYPDKHTITATEKADVIKLLSIVVDDEKKANELFDELYQGYRKNFEEDIQYAYNVIAYAIEYDGKLFELKGNVYGYTSIVNQIVLLQIK